MDIAYSYRQDEYKMTIVSRSEKLSQCRNALNLHSI